MFGSLCLPSWFVSILYDHDSPCLTTFVPVVYHLSSFLSILLSPVKILFHHDFPCSNLVGRLSTTCRSFGSTVLSSVKRVCSTTISPIHLPLVSICLSLCFLSTEIFFHHDFELLSHLSRACLPPSLCPRFSPQHRGFVYNDSPC